MHRGRYYAKASGFAGESNRRLPEQLGTFRFRLSQQAPAGKSLVQNMASQSAGFAH